jgi:transcriptional/translational regulatory protein YebC/TACO1
MDFKYSGTEESLEEALVLGDVDVKSIDLSDGDAEVVTAPNDIDKAKEALKALGVTDYDYCQSTLLANERIELDGDDKKKFEDLLSELDELEDVQNVYHNVSYSLIVNCTKKL